MKTSLLNFLLGLVLVAYAIASPTPGWSFSSLATKHKARIATPVSASEEIGGKNFFHMITAIQKFCGDVMGMDLVKQQLPGYHFRSYKTFGVYRNVDVENLHKCILATRAWVETLDRPQTIHLSIALRGSDQLGGFLSSRSLFGFSEKIRFDISLMINDHSGSPQKVYEALKTNPGITALNLQRNYIDKKNAIALAELLKENNSLQQLNLGQNNIGDEGAIALAEALENSSALGWLGVSDNSISDRGAIAFIKTLSTNSALFWLDLQLNSISPEVKTELMSFSNGSRIIIVSSDKQI